MNILITKRLQPYAFVLLITLHASYIFFSFVQNVLQCGGVVLVGFKPDLDDQLVSFSALTLLVWSSGL